MILSTSDNSAPARINFRMLRTDSLEKKPTSFRACSSAGRSCARDCVAGFIFQHLQLGTPTRSNANRNATIDESGASPPLTPTCAGSPQTWRPTDNGGDGSFWQRSRFVELKGLPFKPFFLPR